MRRAGQQTAKRYAWDQVAEAVLLPRVEIGLPPRPATAKVQPPSVAEAAQETKTPEPIPPLGTGPAGSSRVAA